MFKYFSYILFVSVITVTAHADQDIADRRISGATLTVYPIFGQLLAIAVPKGFKPITETTKGPRYSLVLIPEKETKEKFTEWISISGAKGLASDPYYLPHMMVSQITGIFQMTCPNTFSAVDLGTIKFSGYDVVGTVVSCGLVNKPGETPFSMAAITIAFKGQYDDYSLQWAERGAASNMPIQLNTVTWINKLKRLTPIKLCPIILGEAAPYQSCINQK